VFLIKNGKETGVQKKKRGGDVRDSLGFVIFGLSFHIERKGVIPENPPVAWATGGGGNCILKSSFS